jgi:hypothetical protein
MASPGKETRALYGVGGVKVTSIMDETDLKRRVSKLQTIYTCEIRKKERMMYS